MNYLVKILIDDDGLTVPEEDQACHLAGCVELGGGEPSVLCTGNYTYKPGDSGNGSKYKFKKVSRGGVECRKCLAVVKEFKNIKL